MASIVKIDLNECTGCRNCVDACFLDVIRWNEIEGRPEAAYPEDCAACLACEVECPAQCIDVTALPDRQASVFTPFKK